MIDGLVIFGIFAHEWWWRRKGLVLVLLTLFSPLLTGLQDVHNVPQNKDILLSSRYQPQFRSFTLPREENRPGFGRRSEEHKHPCYYVGTTEQVPRLSTANTSYELQGVNETDPVHINRLYPNTWCYVMWCFFI